MATLVTGAAGFIGSHVAQSLLEAGRGVVGLDDFSGGFRKNVPDPGIFYEGSVLDPGLVKRIFREPSIDSGYHLAASWRGP